MTDTSDEEEVRNTKGNIPLEWYDELSHFGYDIEGKKIAKPASSDKDEVSMIVVALPSYVISIVHVCW